VGQTRQISLLDISTGDELDRLSLATDIVELKFITETLVVTPLFDGGLVFWEYNAELYELSELKVFSAYRDMTVTDLVWLPSDETAQGARKGVLALLDRANGIVNLRAVGYRNLGGASTSPWIVEVNDRGIGSESFQTTVLNIKTDAISMLDTRDGETRLLMLSAQNPSLGAKVSVYKFSP
jgi:hypothetical protein